MSLSGSLDFCKNIVIGSDEGLCFGEVIQTVTELQT